VPILAGIVSSSGTDYTRLVTDLSWDTHSRSMNVFTGISTGLPETFTATYVTDTNVTILANIGEWANTNPAPFVGNMSVVQVGSGPPDFLAASGTISSPATDLQIGLYATAEQSGIVPTDGSTIRSGPGPGTSMQALSDGIAGNQATAHIGFDGPSGSFTVMGIFSFDTPAFGAVPTQDALLCSLSGPDFVTAIGRNTVPLDTMQIIEPGSGAVIWHLDNTGTVYTP
jgi:hypothetical protein